MADHTAARRRAVFLIVLGVIVAVLLIFLLIGLLEGDETDQINQQNNEIITSVLLR